MSEYDFLVIGAGSGGVRAARMAAAKGLRVAIVEESDLGGTCVNVGCIPKKLFVYASHFREDLEDSRGFGWRTPVPPFDWRTLLHNKNEEISRLNGIYRNLLTNAGVEIVAGRGRFVDPATVRVGDRDLGASTFLVATGGVPDRPRIPGGELAIVSDQAFFLEELPKRVAIIGGVYIALEFAGIFHGLGIETHVLYRGELILRGFDSDLRRGLASRLLDRGIDLRCECRVAAIVQSAESQCLQLEDGSEIEDDIALAAIGRSPNTGDLGLVEAGVDVDAEGSIAVDEHSRTSQPSIYAVGDCTNRMNLTPVAIAEAMAMVETAFGVHPTKMSYHNVPSAVFSQPPLATVGLSEEQARKQFTDVEIYRSEFRPLKATLSERKETTLVKLVVDKATDRVLGVHMLGPDAAEIIQGMAVALICGATKAQFDATVGIHPTTAEEFVTLREPLA